MTPSNLKVLKNGRYQLLAPLFSGNAATVWRAIDAQSARECAVKMLHHAVVSAQVRLENEARIIQQLAHRHVVDVTDYFEEGHWCCLVMELAQCGLVDWGRCNGGMSSQQAMGQVLGVLDALQAAHDVGIIHRDIKPSNLLVAGNGDLKLADFGIAHVTANTLSLTTTGAVLGSLAYMAPEQRRGVEEIGPHTDVYSMGITIAEMLSGESSIDLFAERHQERLRLLLEPALAEVLIQAAAYEPAGRFQSARQFAEALEEVCPRHPLVALDAVPREPSVEPVELDSPEAYPVGPTTLIRRNRARWMTWGFMATGLIAGVVLGLNLGPRNQMATPAMTPPVSPASITAWWEAYPKCADQVSAYHTNYTVGPRETLGVGTADLDGDGLSDQVFVNQIDESVNVYWGNGVGTLEDPLLMRGARAESPPAIGDINEDGITDMILAVPDEASFAILLGLGDRKFDSPKSLFQGSNPAFPILADWDGDTVVDLLFQHRDCTAWRKGDGQGGFAGHLCIGPRRVPIGVVRTQRRGFACCL